MGTHLKNTIVFLLIISMIILFSSCTNNKKTDSPEFSAVHTELTAVHTESLMKQVAESDIVLNCSDYLQDEGFVSAEIFGVDRKGDMGTAYMYLYEREYAVFKGKAYEMSSFSGDAILHFRYDGDDVSLVSLQWSAEGREHDHWMSENFPADYLRKARSFHARDMAGINVLSAKLEQLAAEKLSVPVESGSILFINKKDRTYEVIGSKNREDGTFITEIIEKGSLDDFQS